MCVCVARLMNIAQRMRSLLMGIGKLHAVLWVDVLYSRIHSNGFNGSEHPMVTSLNALSLYLTNILVTFCAAFIAQINKAAN